MLKWVLFIKEKTFIRLNLDYLNTTDEIVTKYKPSFFINVLQQNNFNSLHKSRVFIDI